MSACQDAIDLLAAEVDSFGQGTPAQPKDHTPEWFLLRAKSLGLAYLRQASLTGAHNSPVAATALYKKGLQGIKLVAFDGEVK